MNTLLVSCSSIAISPALYKNLNCNIRRDFAGVTQIASQPSLLEVHSSVPARCLKELIALASVLGTLDVKERFAAQGLELSGTAPAEFDAYLGAKSVKWDGLVRATGVRVE